MSRRGLLGAAKVAVFVVVTAGCTQSKWNPASDLHAGTEGGVALPRPHPPKKQQMDAAPLPDATDATIPEDSSTRDSGVDAPAEATARHFPHVDYDAFPPVPKGPVCPSSGMLSVTPSDTFFRLGPSETILGSVSPDGLTAAWTVPSSPGDAGPTAIFVADRASAQDGFGAPDLVDFGPTLVAEDKVALSPDRLRLVAVRADLQAFVELTRSGPGAPFGTPAEDTFAAINAAAQATKDPLGDPTFAGDDRAFFYTRALAIIESERTSTTPWPEGTATSLDYAVNPGQRPRLSAVSGDHLTLFFWDDQRLVENAAWRVLPDEPFRTIIRLPQVPRAQPTASCTSIYFGSSDPSGDIYLALATASVGP